ncbi:MAG: MFS transporter [Sedimentibacter saalensis]|uniref:MFS transporter n=1 Tax=Sedimentibacter saalensis TaxID=130788 RepID=UPI0031585ADF
MNNQKISLAEKLGYGSFSISCNIVVQFVSTFILFYYTNVFKISPAVAGAIVSFGVIWDGINDPLIAHFADNHRFKNGERVRPYMLYICAPLAITTILMFMPFNMPQNMKPFYGMFIYVVFYSFTTFLRLPSYAMPILATSDGMERISINTYTSGGASLGGVLASVLCWPLVRIFSGVDTNGDMINPSRGFPLAAAVIGVFVIAGALFSYFTSRERVKPKNENEEKLSLGKSFTIVMKNYNFRWNTAFSTLYFVNNALLTSTLVYYCSYVFKDSGLTTYVMAAFAVGSIIALPFIKRLDKALGRRRAMMLGAALIFISKIPFLIFPMNVFAMYVNAFIMGLSVALNIVTFSTTRAEVADHVEYENNRRIDSMVINFMGFLNKCGTSITTLIIGISLQMAGYNADLKIQPQSVTTTLIGLIGWMSIAMSVVMFYCASKITIEETVKQMSREKELAAEQLLS